MSMGRVVEEVQIFSGTQFDPAVADAFLALVEREGDGFIERASKFDIQEFIAEAAGIE
jgi:HD-GYP domain-containing protein (c-di-GMP phosphodiesterase class II)